MPFTPSHAIVALPFMRREWLVAPIAIAAMAPDVPLFTRGFPIPYYLTHDLTFLPLTVLLAFGLLVLWRCVLRPAFRELSPRPLAARLPPGWDAGPAAGWRQTVRGGPGGFWFVLAVAAALAFGIVTHVVWDSFSHVGRAGVQLVPALGELWGPWPGYTWVQRVSGVGGVLILLVAAALWWRNRTPRYRVDRVLPGWVRLLWWLSLPVLLTLALGVGVVVFTGLSESLTPEQLAYRVLPPAVGVWGLATVGVAVAVMVLRARSRA